MDANVVQAISGAFISMAPYACLIGILTRIVRSFVHVFSGGEELI